MTHRTNPADSPTRHGRAATANSPKGKALASIPQSLTLAFLFPWQLLVFSGSIVLIICLSTAALSIWKVLRADAKLLMGS